MLSDVITSKSRVKLLNVFLSSPYEMYHVREAVRRTGDEINAVRRELQFLEKKGILNKEQRANRIYYSLDKNYSFVWSGVVVSGVTESPSVPGNSPPVNNE